MTTLTESNLAHYQKQPDSYSWKKTNGSLGPQKGPTDSEEKKKQVDHLGPHGPKGFKSQSQMDHLGPQWPKGFKRKTKWITWAPSGPRDSRGKHSGSLGHPVAQGIHEPKNPSLCGSNIREPDYLRHCSYLTASKSRTAEKSRG